ncbi:PEX2 [Blepharisma stoltei]|uniref:RING-type E3 ubiquitin transferase (cysteine targeting) n=1 Tax=Blepharisma stoltei TaxID=1481888 RepID=A0AAU9JZW7_9CILI|nr:unnamed protein product [Blepharisma stoltei]
MSTYKVSQLDAYFLDKIYHQFIKEQFLKPFAYSGWIKIAIEIGIMTFYQYFTLWKGANTPGNKLYNVKYQFSGSFALKMIHYSLECLNILIGIIKEKSPAAHRLWSLGVGANWITFLIFGKYRTLMERFGKISLELINPEARRNVNYSYTNRILIFQIITDTMRAVLPMLKIDQILRFFFDEISLSYEGDQSCVICGEEDVVTPQHLGSCQHLACYVCISKSKQKACPRCQ